MNKRYIKKLRVFLVLVVMIFSVFMKLPNIAKAEEQTNVDMFKNQILTKIDIGDISRTTSEVVENKYPVVIGKIEKHEEEENIKLKINIENISEKEINGVVIVKLIDNNGRAYKIQHEIANIVSGNNIVEFKLNLSDYPNGIKGIKVYIWDNLDNMKPLSNIKNKTFMAQDDEDFELPQKDRLGIWVDMQKEDTIIKYKSNNGDFEKIQGIKDKVTGKIVLTQAEKDRQPVFRRHNDINWIDFDAKYYEHLNLTSEQQVGTAFVVFYDKTPLDSPGYSCPMGEYYEGGPLSDNMMDGRSKLVSNLMVNGIPVTTEGQKRIRKENVLMTITPNAKSGGRDSDSRVICFGRNKSYGSFNLYYTGYIAEIIIYNTVLPDEEINQINKCLMQKYNISYIEDDGKEDDEDFELPQKDRLGIWVDMQKEDTIIKYKSNNGDFEKIQGIKDKVTGKIVLTQAEKDRQPVFRRHNDINWIDFDAKYYEHLNLTSEQQVGTAFVVFYDKTPLDSPGYSCPMGEYYEGGPLSDNMVDGRSKLVSNLMVNGITVDIGEQKRIREENVLMTITPNAKSGGRDSDSRVICFGRNGSSGSFNLYYTGYIAEIIIYNTVLPDEEINQINKCLMQKYNIK